MLHPAVFHWLDCFWGAHTVDRFANASNAQLERFKSRFFTPGTEVVDAFTCNWVEDNNWCFLPVHLIPRVIRHAQNKRTEGTLIVPQWFCLPFWPLLFPNRANPVDFVVGCCELPSSEELIMPRPVRQ